MTTKLDVRAELLKLAPELGQLSDWRSILINTPILKLREVLPRSAIPAISTLMSRAIEGSEHDAARNWLFLGFLVHEDRMLDEVRRSGALRSSKYKFDGRSIRELIGAIQGPSSSLPISISTEAYLASVFNLAQLAPAIREINRSIRDVLKRRSLVVLKTVVALVDSLFLLRHNNDWSAPTDDWHHYPAEDLAEAASYIIHCLDSDTGISDSEFQFIDEDGLVSGFYHKLLVKACKIRKFLEAEILVDAFSYTCRRRSKSLVVGPPSPEFEKSIRLGYILSEQAEQRRSIGLTIAVKNGAPSIEGIADLFFRKFKNDVVVFNPLPIPRYLFALPAHPLLIRFFNDDALLPEEQNYLGEVLEWELATWDELSKFRIAGDLSVVELLKLRRMFIFVSRIAALQLSGIFKEDPALAYRSLVPVFELSVLQQLLNWCLPAKSVETAIDMLSWMSGANSVVDLQYRPILRGRRYFLTPMNIAGTMNWYRNLAHTQKRRIIDVAEEEAASRALLETFSQTDGLVRKGFRTKILGQEIEIDIVFRFGDIVFLFECKHALHPCNAHELRTSFEHIKKGADTLSRAKALFADKANQVEFYRRLGWEVPVSEEIITCLVSCNGMFPGLRLDGHPVRRWPELRNMVESGVIRIGVAHVTGDGVDEAAELDTNDTVERNVWGGPELTADFLKRYLQEDFLHRDLFEAMEPLEQCFGLGTKSLNFSTYVLNAISLRRATERRQV